MQTISVDEAQTHLSEIIEKLAPGEEIVLTREDQPVARLVGTQQRTSWPCKAGSATDKILWMAPDFDAIPEGFEEYL